MTHFGFVEGERDAEFEYFAGASASVLFSPPAAKWWYSFDGTRSIRFHVVNAPNVVHRWMQRVCLGIHWERV